jgi:signal peptidase II
MKSYLWAILVIVADRISKMLVIDNMTLGESIPLIGNNFLRFTYVQNPGIAFGIHIFPNTFHLVFSLAASVVLIIYLFHIRGQSSFLKIPLSLILGGALGNAIDRIFYGQVIDFIDFDFPNFIMSRWPVFNLADSAVTIGMILLVIYLIFMVEPDTATSSHPAVL